MLTHVVYDIEGTTSSTGFVHDTLYPYSRERFAAYIDEHGHDPQVIAQLDAVRELAGEPDADVERIVWWLNHWLDDDQKVTPLKAFQGWIWTDGFAAGDLTSHFFADSIPAIRRHHAEGRTLSIFSSGSVSAQLAWFGNTPDGSLLDLFSHHFDTENIGPKRVTESYDLIASRLGAPADEIVFFSDLVAELDAARDAGWHTVGVRRQGDQYFDQGVGDHLAIFSFDEIDLSGDAPTLVDRAANTR
ncbi:acireductone synthase [Ilumatobacter coccineus]|uniref:Enolase-phosphatase E1 n=1 Tax=Ilumatobacter coccineus (strain NBRC 103263 / KCTC 29153 / YM16-304) TaxID=1313172 RepID=A0A6C7EGM5_ILUCY|nr:acireductone synthase [Ilumatobacter coccineus]BAN03116.1 enolase-phosphatase E1 [Ilumatobacter coccineus YM16-304]